MKSRNRVFVSLTVLCALVLWVISASAVGLDVPKRTQSEIDSFINSHSAATPATIYGKEPVTTGPDYDPGSLTAEALQAALNAVNQVRYVAGISSNITLNAAYTEKCQAGALVNAANNKMSHTPDKPTDMEDALFNLGYDGTSHSNLGMGYSSLSDAVFFGWMSDDDSGNIDRLGHRRWVLNPKMTATGFGKVGRFTAMYALDTSSTAGVPETVAWPAQMMPMKWMYSSLPWHVSFKSGVTSSVRVTLTRREDGQTWHFSGSEDEDGYFKVNSGGYGTGTAVIFRPKDITYYGGDIFDVKIEGANIGTLQYTVELYSYNIEHAKISEIAPQKYTGSEIQPAVTVSMGSTVLQEGTDYKLEYSYNINAGYARVTISGINRYSGSATKYFTIEPAEISEASFTVEDLTFTGSELPCPKLDGVFAGTTLQLNNHYTIKTYDRLTNVGEGYVTVAGTGNFTGEQTILFRVLPCDLTIISPSLDQSLFTFTGNPCMPKLYKPSLSRYSLQEETDYTLTYESNLHAGSATATATGKGNFTGTVKLPFTIEKAKAAFVTLPEAKTGLVYNGTPQELLTPGTADGGEMQYAPGEEGQIAPTGGWSTTIPTGVLPGSYCVWYMAVGDADHEDVKGTYIYAVIEVNKALESVEQLLGDLPAADTITGRDRETIAMARSAYDALTEQERNLISAEALQRLLDAEAALAAWEHRIDLSRVTVAQIGDQLYSGKPLMPELTLTWEGNPLVADTDYQVSWRSNTQVGTATAKLTGIGAYRGNTTVSFRILPKAVKLTSLKAGSRKLTVKWQKGKGIDGYEIQYSLKKSFKGAKTVTITKASTKKTDILKLKPGKKYYVRVRAWKKVGKTMFYSAWSNVKNAKTKK